MELNDLLAWPFALLGFEKKFCEQCRVMGFDCIRDIIQTPPMELREKAGFTYGWLAELSGYLQEKKLLYLLQSPPGRKPGQAGESF
jgi:hypothetical protein